MAVSAWRKSRANARHDQPNMSDPRARLLRVDLGLLAQEARCPGSCRCCKNSSRLMAFPSHGAGRPSAVLRGAWRKHQNLATHGRLMKGAAKGEEPFTMKGKDV
jgi:hypothetical protein